MAKSYWEKLQHPLWQQMRLRVLERDKFTCIGCGTKDVTLHVHHGYYEKHCDPWDYPIESLHTLCKDCHAAATDQQAELNQIIGRIDPGRLGSLTRLLDVLTATDANDPESWFQHRQDVEWVLAEFMGYCEFDIHASWGN